MYEKTRVHLYLLFIPLRFSFLFLRGGKSVSFFFSLQYRLAYRRHCLPTCFLYIPGMSCVPIPTCPFSMFMYLEVL
ncbi:hypothetical protein GGR52DRAFT_224102 [Hypoxylon sp. FL1284]|nr:hypothetical protein GGR52DRAFT_224102 [Hypoxylon sp. FL1284]